MANSRYSIKEVIQFLAGCIKSVIMVTGTLFLLMVLLAFTRLPYEVHRWLGYAESEYKFRPECLILLGGSGMPSESNLIRLYYLQNLAAQYPEAGIILTHPSDTSVVEEMAVFLQKMGVKSDRISRMLNGTNTISQAEELKKGFPDLERKKIVIVTSPENMYRTLKVFRKLKYVHIGGEPAYENAMYVDLSYDSRKLGDKYYVPDVSSNMSLRYDFWNYMKLEVTCLREFAALAYYKLNGWI